MYSHHPCTGECFRFGGGFYCARLGAATPNGSSQRDEARDVLADLPKSLYGGFDSLDLGDAGGLDDAEKMLLFPESVIKAAVDTLKEVSWPSVGYITNRPPARRWLGIPARTPTLALPRSHTRARPTSSDTRPRARQVAIEDVKSEYNKLRLI